MPIYKYLHAVILVLSFPGYLPAQVTRDSNLKIKQQNPIIARPVISRDTSSQRIKDINALYNAKEKEVETQYAKLIADTRSNIKQLNSQVKILQKKIDSLKQDSKITDALCAKILATAKQPDKSKTEQACKQKLDNNNKQIQSCKQQIEGKKTSIKDQLQKIAQLEKLKQKALEELRKQRQTAVRQK